MEQKTMVNDLCCARFSLMHTTPKKIIFFEQFSEYKNWKREKKNIGRIALTWIQWKMIHDKYGNWGATTTCRKSVTYMMKLSLCKYVPSTITFASHTQIHTHKRIEKSRTMANKSATNNVCWCAYKWNMRSLMFSFFCCAFAGVPYVCECLFDTRMIHCEHSGAFKTYAQLDSFLYFQHSWRINGTAFTFVTVNCYEYDICLDLNRKFIEKFCHFFHSF